MPGSLGWGSAVFAATATLAPSRAARSAIARPMPRLAPVMNSVLFFNVIVFHHGDTEGTENNHERHDIGKNKAD